MPICFEVRVNDGEPTIAGRSDINVLITAITYGAAHGDLEIRAGGLVTEGPDDGQHLDWLVRELQLGDHVSIRIVNSDSPSLPVDSRPRSQDRS